MYSRGRRPQRNVALLEHGGEVRAYKAIRALHGSADPKPIASFMLDVTFAPPPKDVQNLFYIPGILLQFINGFQPSELTQQTPMTCWEQIISDVLPRNIIVARRGANEAQPYIVDFTLLILSA
ncbi:hypothetical protein BKA67DRAFT_541410 [Truncatella angustata]|uniref:Uncharacterized protein n=1 Tax=Truncatella angustata TaxID=152316 RepID=A0A9P8UBR7_9PEZI|nr:uncharacterized protein BKA67DRAFT_541410 [Truncatella angustata]KAH6646442.1 hypothetical protein BKA67DRAFT_541410 [Truncatella angustata]